MRVAITGSSGLLGSALRGALTGAGHHAVPVVRREPRQGEIGWDPAAGRIDARGFEGVDAVVNLAGAGIGDARWTDARKQLLRDSRIDSTRLLAQTLSSLDRRPAVLLSASGMDYYGDRGDDVLTEGDPPGGGFLARLCVDWEEAAAPAAEAGIRTALLRTSIVLSGDGGALARMLLPFRLGIGGRLGPGDQWWSWISVDDHVRAMLHLLEADVSGPVNMAAPHPVTNREFTRALGRELGRPTIVPIPSFGPRLLLGSELAEVLLFESKRLAPTVLEGSRFTFRHPTIDVALAAALGQAEVA